MAIPVEAQGSNTVSPARVNPAEDNIASSQDFDRAVTTARNGTSAGGSGPVTPAGGGNGGGGGVQESAAPDPSAQGPTPENSQVAYAVSMPLADPSSQVEPPPPTRQDLENDPDGRLIYTAQEQDTVATIADRFGRTEEEIIAANPRLAQPSADAEAPPTIDPGQPIIIYNDDRAPAIVELVNTTDPERRGELIHQQLLAAVHGKGGNTPTPGDHLAAARAELIVLKPGDDAFRQQVLDQSDELTYNWQSLGLTHDVWDPLLEAANNGDWTAFDTILTEQLQALAFTSPTVAEIEAFGQVLQNYAPNEQFRSNASRTIEDFLVNDPAAAAEELASANFNSGYEASQRLRELTDPLTVDPLTAALIAKAAAPTIAYILEDLEYPNVTNLETYQNLSAIADSAIRSPEGEEVLETIVDAFLPDGQASLDDRKLGVVLGFTGEASTPPILSLAIAERLVQRGDIEQSTAILQFVMEGVRAQEGQLVDTVNSLSETLLPLFTPIQWDVFLSAPNDQFEIPDLQALGEQWLNENPDIKEQVDAALEQINEQMYWLNRSRQHLADYAPRLNALEGHEEMVELSRADTSEEEHPQIAFASHLSPASAIEDLRKANLAGIDDGTLTSLSQIVLDPNWHLRMYPRTANALAEAAGRSQPFPSSLGLSLYNGALYGSGVVNQGRELMAKIEAHGFFDAIFQAGGWRNIVTGFHFGWGTAIEGTALANRITGRNLPSSSVWGRLLDNSLLGRSFAIYNVFGTATYALEGNERAAAALGIAAVGSVTNNFLIRQGSRFFIPRLAATGWAAPGANILMLVGTGLLIVNDIVDREQLAARSEPFNEAYLVAAGVDPDIARHLANNSPALFNGVFSDNPGASPAGPLEALAEYRGISPGELLQWLNEQEPNFVAVFIDRIHRVHPNDDGTYPVTREPEGLGWDWGRLLEFSSPLTVDGVPAELLIGDPGAIKTRQSLEDIANWAEDVGVPLPQG